MPCTADDLLQSFAASATKLLQSNTHMGPPQEDTTFTLLLQIGADYDDVATVLPRADAEHDGGSSLQHSGFWSRVEAADPEAAALQDAPSPHKQLQIKSPHTLMKIISAGTMCMQMSGYRAPANAASTRAS